MLRTRWFARVQPSSQVLPRQPLPIQPPPLLKTPQRATISALRSFLRQCGLGVVHPSIALTSPFTGRQEQPPSSTTSLNSRYSLTKNGSLKCTISCARPGTRGCNEYRQCRYGHKTCTMGSVNRGAETDACDWLVRSGGCSQRSYVGVVVCAIHKEMCSVFHIASIHCGCINTPLGTPTHCDGGDVRVVVPICIVHAIRM